MVNGEEFIPQDESPPFAFALLCCLRGTRRQRRDRPAPWCATASPAKRHYCRKILRRRLAWESSIKSYGAIVVLLIKAILLLSGDHEGVLMVPCPPYTYAIT